MFSGYLRNTECKPMPRPLATLRCTIPERKSLSEPAAKRKNKEI